MDGREAPPARGSAKLRNRAGSLSGFALPVSAKAPTRSVRIQWPRRSSLREGGHAAKQTAYAVEQIQITYFRVVEQCHNARAASGTTRSTFLERFHKKCGRERERVEVLSARLRSQLRSRFRPQFNLIRCSHPCGGGNAGREPRFRHPIQNKTGRPAAAGC